MQSCIFKVLIRAGTFHDSYMKKQGADNANHAVMASECAYLSQD